MHDRLQKTLVDRLRDSGRYDEIIQNYEYKVDGIIRGELDVIAFTRDSVHIYEVKSNKHKLHKATEQLKRFHELTHPTIQPKYIFYSPKKVKRIYI